MYMYIYIYMHACYDIHVHLNIVLLNKDLQWYHILFMLKCKDELSIMFEFDAFSLQNVSISKIFEYHELRWITSLCRGKFTEKTSKSVV